jgi:hypothetical protein
MTEEIKDGKEYAALVGLDWADREHAWVLQWGDTGARERGRLEQTPEAVERWLSELMVRLDGRRIAVAIEQKHGAVVWMLLKYGCVEIYPSIRKRLASFATRSIHRAVRAIQRMGSCYWNCCCIIAIVFMFWNRKTNPRGAC